MKPVSLTLRGAAGIKDGLGLDEITIDFTRFEPGVIALVGPNGSGKTTILDNLHPYRRLASRDGSLGEHFTLKNSTRDLTIEAEGYVYRCLLMIDGVTGKQEAYLYRNGEAMNDGKVTTYDTAVEREFGSADLFFRSAFTSQDSESITELPSGKRKDLMLEVLGFHQYEAYAEYAKHERDVRQDELTGLLFKLQAMGDPDTTIAELDAQGLAIGAQVEQTKGRVEVLGESLRLKRSERVEIEGLMAEAKAREGTRHQLYGEIAAVKKEIAQESATYTQAKRENDQQAEDTRAKIDRDKKIVDNEAKIHASVKALREARAKVQDQRAKCQAWSEVEREWQEAWHTNQVEISNAEKAIREAEKEVWAARGAVDGETAERQGLITFKKRMMAEQVKTAALTDQVPCASLQGVPQQCKLLAVAFRSKAEAERQQAEVTALEAAGTSPELAERLRLAETTLAEVSFVPQPIDEAPYIERKAATDWSQLDESWAMKIVRELEAQNWEALEGECSLASARLESAAAQLVQIEAAGKAVYDQYIERNTGLSARDQRLNDQLSRLVGMGVELWQAKAQQADAAIRGLESEQVDATNRVTALSATLGTLNDKRRAAVEAKASAAGLQEQVEKARTTVETWELLRQACSRDGIPALEIDAAAPAISQIANDLLAGAFGTRFQIQFETTRQSKDGKKLVETFEIHVYGDGEERKIENLSGGQRVWIERAIQDAITIYMGRKSGHRHATNFTDEADGALDPQARQKFLDMLRSSLKVGQRHFTILISQSQELWSQVQQRIHLNPTEQTLTLRV